MKGLIALDIDGTAAAPAHPVSQEVCNYLKTLVKDRWEIVFVTGRTFQFGYQAILPLDFSYYFIVQNGAITIEMPSRTILERKYLGKEIIPIMNEICADQPSDFIIYAGFEYGDQCFYRPKYFSEHLLDYLKVRTKKFGEIWHDVTSFDQLDVAHFASVKCFGDYPSATLLAKRIEAKLNLHVPLIRDPFNNNYFVAQATHPEISKGEAINRLAELLDHKGLIIAAGDDLNDCSMFERADIKIVMATAPVEVKAFADIIAPPAEENGIIQGLQKAIEISVGKSKS